MIDLHENCEEQKSKITVRGICNKLHRTGVKASQPIIHTIYNEKYGDHTTRCKLIRSKNQKNKVVHLEHYISSVILP